LNHLGHPEQRLGFSKNHLAGSSLPTENSTNKFQVDQMGRVFAAIYNSNLDKAIPRLINEMNALKDEREA
jgi:hypothetical protein